MTRRWSSHYSGVASPRTQRLTVPAGMNALLEHSTPLENKRTDPELFPFCGEGGHAHGLVDEMLFVVVYPMIRIPPMAFPQVEEPGNSRKRTRRTQRLQAK